MTDIVIGVLGLGLSLSVLVWTIYIFWGDYLGAPFVPTDRWTIDTILSVVNRDSKGIFIDLGCGDGRVIRQVIKNSKLKGVGWEVNPFLVILARFASKDITGCTYIKGDFWKDNLAMANYVYCYLSPEAMIKLEKKLLKELRPGTIVISKVFEMKNWKDMLVQKIQKEENAIFIYKIV